MKYINFFTEGGAKINSPDDFLSSNIGKYLQKIYGPIVFRTDNIPINFIDVFNINGQYHIMDVMFFNKTGALKDYKVGYFFPIKYEYLLQFPFECQESWHNPVGLALSKFGFASLWRPEVLTIEELKNQKWSKLPNTVFDSENNYDVVEEYVAAQKGTVQFLDKEKICFQQMIANTFADNMLISACADNAQTRAQRMTNGNELIPHFDADENEPYLFSGLSWYLDTKKFTGRKLVCGKRSAEDLANFIDHYLNDKYYHSYNNKINDLNDIVSFTPTSELNLLVNTANPLYYHAVTKMEGEGAIYTIISDCRMHND